MKPPSIVIDHFLSTKWSKKLFTINHYELQNGKCIVTQELSAYHVDPNLFGKIRSSCIVNLEYVQEVVRDELLLKNGESLFVSRNYRHTIKSQHLNFIRNHF